MKRLFILWSMCVIFCGNMIWAKTVDVKSPSGTLRVSVDVKDKIYYSVYAGTDLLLKDCSLALDLGTEVLGESPKLRSTKRGKVEEKIKREIPIKNVLVANYCNTLRLNFSGNYSVEFRVFDNGVAYRFITDKKKDIEIVNEDFTINFPETYMAHISKTSGFKTSYENPYTHVKTVDYKGNDEMSYFPVLLETPKGYNILISEAD